MNNDCNCSGSERVIYVCCPQQGTQLPQQTPTPIPTPTPTPTPTPMPTPICSRVLVRIDSIQVGRSGTEDDPGASAEWFLTIVVNGQSRTWLSQDVRDNNTYLIGFDFAVNLINQSATLQIATSGYEDDNLSANDDLPAAQQTHGSSDNWGIGASRSLAGANSEFTYSIYYTVTCLQQALTSVISNNEAINFVQRRIEGRSIKNTRSGDELLTLFITKMSAKGLELKQIDSGLMIWEGPTPVHKLAQTTFSTHNRKK